MTTIVDRTTWPRREHYAFFAPMSHPFYALTFPVDVTALRAYVKAHGLSFYLGMVYAVTKAMDRVTAFHYKCRGEEIIHCDHLVPSFTDLTPGTDLFHITSLETGDDLADFCRRAKALSAAQSELMSGGDWDPEAMIYFTCLPWFPMTCCTNERDADPTDSVPRVAWGKYEERGGRTVLSLSLELNHRLLDGVHVGQFFEALQAFLGAL